MDNTKIGKLICTLRKEKGMTQRQLAECMNIFYHNIRGGNTQM